VPSKRFDYALRLCASTEILLPSEQLLAGVAMSAPTMLEVAKRANVALSTVSYALNGTRPISEETRQRIWQAMSELGYQPHALARGLASRRSHIIALLFPALPRGFGATELEFVTGAAEAAQNRGYHLVLWPMEIHAVDELQQLVRQSLVDGVLVMEVRLNDERIDLLQQIGVPFSMIGRPSEASDLSFADIDFEQTTRDGVSYLVQLGHRQIAFLNHAEETFTAGYGPSVRAAAGFEQVTRSAGLTPITRFCDDTVLAGQQAFDELIAAHPDVTAIATMNERATVGVMQAATARGWRIPDDLSILSLVSSPRVAEMTMPPLTALTPASAELGRLGVETLIGQLEEDHPELVQRLLPCRLVIRGSTGTAPYPALRAQLTAPSD
jgi:DNA-binding LacI/PurR family transcriptional regulator